MPADVNESPAAHGEIFAAAGQTCDAQGRGRRVGTRPRRTLVAGLMRNDVRPSSKVPITRTSRGSSEARAKIVVGATDQHKWCRAAPDRRRHRSNAAADCPRTKGEPTPPTQRSAPRPGSARRPAERRAKGGRRQCRRPAPGHCDRRCRVGNPSLTARQPTRARFERWTRLERSVGPPPKGWNSLPRRDGGPHQKFRIPDDGIWDPRRAFAQLGPSSMVEA